MRKFITVATHTFYQFLSRLSTGFVALLITPLLTAYLGRSDYGIYQMILTYVTLFWILTDFGLNAIFVKEMTKNENEVPNLLGALFVLRVINGFAVTVVAIIIMLFLPYPEIARIGIIIASLTIFAQSLMGVGSAIFQVQTRLENTFWATLAGSVCLLFTTVLIIQLKLNLLALAFVLSLSYWVMAVVSLVLTNHLIRLRIRKTFAYLYPLFQRSLPFGLALLFSLFAFKIDAILLATLKLPNGLANSDAVAVYTLPYRMFELVLAIPVFLMNVLYPILIRKLKESMQDFLETVKQTALAVTVFSFLGIAATWFLAPFFINFLAKTGGFTDSINVLRILILSYPLFFYSNLILWILMIFEKQKSLIVVYGLAFLFNLVANFIFIPRYSFWASAWITGATESLILILLAFSLWRLSRFKIPMALAQKG